MMASLISPRHWTLERAMREWARTDDTVAESVRAADRRVLAAVRTAFQDYGFDADRGRTAGRRRRSPWVSVSSTCPARHPTRGRPPRASDSCDLMLAH